MRRERGDDKDAKCVACVMDGSIQILINGIGSSWKRTVEVEITFAVFL